ncbi:MAG: hypothetical protein O7H39_07975 [Gammaproteobacteria bacterium]|nr:hypothetical protein [Gammaproteobacteria bacterium]
MSEPTHRVETLAGTGVAGFSGDGRIDAATQVAEPFGVVTGPDGALYFCDLGNHRVRRVDLESMQISTVAGSGENGYAGDGGAALLADLNEPYEVRFDGAGNMYFVDMQAHVVRRVSRQTGVIETVAGTGEPGFSGDGGPATEASFKQPHSIEVARDGTLYIADLGNHRIRMVDPASGTVTTFAGTGLQEATTDDESLTGTSLNGPRTMAFDEMGDLFLTLREGNAVYRIDMSAQTIHHVAGTGKLGYSGDGGDATAADLAGPKGISVDAAAVYIADTESHTIRRIDRETGIISTLLGDGSKHDGPDGDPMDCGLARPHGVFAAPDGRVFIGDSDNHRVRVLTTR